MNQLNFTEATEAQVRCDFREASHKLLSGVLSDSERTEAVDAIERSRGILILDYGYTLERLCEVVDEPEPEVA